MFVLLTFKGFLLFKKINLELIFLMTLCAVQIQSHKMASQHLGIYLKEAVGQVCIDVCTRLLTAPFFYNGKTEKVSKCLLIKDRLSQLGPSHTVK